MYSIAQRANGIFSYATTVLSFLLLAISTTTFLFQRSISNSGAKPTVDIKNLAVMGRLPYDYKQVQQEFAIARFDIDVDFTPLFNWNTKQIFAFIVADYQSKDFKRNEVVLYDRIIRSKKFAHLRTKGQKNKYNFPEITHSFKDLNATFSLHWDIMPYVGFLTDGVVSETQGFRSIKFPPVNAA